jgi:hypothetical protein
MANQATKYRYHATRSSPPQAISDNVRFNNDEGLAASWLCSSRPWRPCAANGAGTPSSASHRRFQMSVRDEFSTSSWGVTAVSSPPCNNSGRRQLQEAAAHLLILASVVLFAAAGVAALLARTSPALQPALVTMQQCAATRSNESSLAVPLLP